MGHFIIQLPDNQKGDVRRGTVRKMGNLLQLFRMQAPDDERIGYIIRIEPWEQEQREYRLLKSKSGVWLTNTVAGFGLEKDDVLSLQIKEAIDAHESVIH